MLEANFQTVKLGSKCSWNRKSNLVVLDKMRKVEKHSKEKRETGADEAVGARGKANKTGKALWHKIADDNVTKKAVDDLKALKNNRASRDCAGGKFPDCKTWCCALGCDLKGETAYYAQCAGIGGKSWCDKKDALEAFEVDMKKT